MMVVASTTSSIDIALHTHSKVTKQRELHI